MMADDCFVEFGVHMAHLFQEGLYTNDDLAKATSYFWERFNQNYKEKWKTWAKEKNLREGRRGKRKMRGFWYFAIHLEKHMLNADYLIFYDLFQYLKPVDRRTWYYPEDALIHQELYKII